jgi:trigger factor
VKTKVEELPESRVRLEVEVPEGDVQHALEHAASDLAGSLRIPGFRKGKAPVNVVAARVGREALWQEAIRSHIDSWFWNAAEGSGIRPVASPEVEFGDLPPDGDTFRFTATVAVAPKPDVADWTALEVPFAEAEVPTELVEHELGRVQETAAELVPVDGRPVREGDTVVLDITGEGVPPQLDYVTEVGSGRLVDELEAALPGMKAGETKTVGLALEEQAEGASVDLTVKDLKEKSLPELDDELARAATEFDTLAELRTSIEERLHEQLAAELEAQFRESAVDALAAASAIEGIEPLVERRAAELWAGISRSLEMRGIPAETYLTMTGQSESDLVERLRAEATRAVSRELVLEAVAEKLDLSVTDEEVEALVREQAEEGGEGPDEILAALRQRGGFERLRSDLRLRKALDEIVAGVKRIPVELAQAREKLWTPEKEKGGTGMKIWIPGNEEAR